MAVFDPLPVTQPQVEYHLRLFRTTTPLGVDEVGEQAKSKAKTYSSQPSLDYKGQHPEDKRWAAPSTNFDG